MNRLTIADMVRVLHDENEPMTLEVYDALIEQAGLLMDRAQIGHRRAITACSSVVIVLASERMAILRQHWHRTLQHMPDQLKLRHQQAVLDLNTAIRSRPDVFFDNHRLCWDSRGIDAAETSLLMLTALAGHR